jgi:hypothetical protein
MYDNIHAVLCCQDRKKEIYLKVRSHVLWWVYWSTIRSGMREKYFWRSEAMIYEKFAQITIEAICCKQQHLMMRYWQWEMKFGKVKTVKREWRSRLNKCDICFQIFCMFHIFVVTMKLIYKIIFYLGARGSVVVKALCCKPEGRGFKSRWGGFF